MELTVVRADDSVTHLRLVGRLDIESVNQVQSPFVFNTAARRKSTLVDLSEVTFIGSLGIGMLLGVAKALRRHGVKMVLLAPRAMVEETLRTAGIHEVIPIAADEPSALELLR